MNKTWVEEMQVFCEFSDEFEEYAAEEVDEYCDILAKMPGMTRPIEEGDDWVGENWTHMWTDAASKLIEAEIVRYQKMGFKYFQEDIDIHSRLRGYREP